MIEHSSSIIPNSTFTRLSLKYSILNVCYAEEAVHAALWDYAQKHHIEIEGLKKPKSDIHEGEEAEEEEY